MRFVIGGADSGKRDFVRENYGIDEILMADYDSVLTAKAVYDFHIFIKKLMADGKDIVAVIDEISEKNHDITLKAIRSLNNVYTCNRRKRKRKV